MESGYRAVYEKLWQDIRMRDPNEITEVRAVSYIPDTKQFIVKFFDSDYIVDTAEEKIYRKSDEVVPNVVGKIIILNYLADAKPFTKSQPNWVTIKEIPGGMIFYPAFYKNGISVLIETFGDNAERLIKVADSLGGQAGPFGNTSVIFQAFPEVPLCVVVWEGDDEVPANANILYDPSIEQILQNAICIDLGTYLAGQLKEIATKMFNS